MPLTLKNFNSTGGGGWQPGANTILYCPLDNNIDDITGNYTMVSRGTVSKGSIGYTFNNGCVYTNSSFNGPTSGTISVWIKQASRSNNATVAAHMIPSSPYNLFTIKYSATDSSIVSWRNNGYIIPEYSVQGGSNPIELPYLTEISLNTWTHLAITHGNEGTTFYINGVQVATDSNTSDLLTNSCPFYIGSNYANFNQYFIGEISNVIFENKARTAQEISDYYDLTKSLYGIS